VTGCKREDALTMTFLRSHNEAIYNLCSSPIIIRVIKSRIMKLRGGCSTLGRDEKCIELFVWRQLGRPRRRWENNIEVDLQGIRVGHGL
jgi:hypothetical protein